MNNTLGDPGTARTGCGQAGVDSSVVRPTRPGKVVPGRYSLNAIARVLLCSCSQTGSLRYRANTAVGFQVLTRVRWSSWPEDWCTLMALLTDPWVVVLDRLVCPLLWPSSAAVVRRRRVGGVHVEPPQRSEEVRRGRRRAVSHARAARGSTVWPAAGLGSGPA